MIVDKYGLIKEVDEEGYKLESTGPAELELDKAGSEEATAEVEVGIVTGFSVKKNYNE